MSPDSSLAEVAARELEYLLILVKVCNRVGGSPSVHRQRQPHAGIAGRRIDHGCPAPVGDRW